MTRALRTLICALVVAVPLPALAQPKAGPPSSPPSSPPATFSPDSSPQNEPKTKEQLEAQQHFQRAKDLYQTGSYREAIAELEAARLLDPKAKDLVFNLGIVHEKLGKFEEAITFFRQYMEMEVTPAERAKAETIIKRIEGAKREVPTNPAASGAGTSTRPAPALPADNRRGRVDVATVNAAAIAGVGFGVGITFGILALANQPKGFVTGRDGTYEQLKTRQSDAHRQAVIADIAFGVGIVATAAAAYLYFGRTKTPKTTAIVPAISPVASGGVLMLGGSFR